ncbi:unnamed protein product [Prorocentrum cordatum]|uniref:Cyclic nucleotide-binding domain-containing protein n=1 Tax=Prorocentrum cordatum TaxID=2364126 RepID=A0ABN9QR25_9DINO|nr:unnamed protein product [Polarella glacialis]
MPGTSPNGCTRASSSSSAWRCTPPSLGASLARSPARVLRRCSATATKNGSSATSALTRWASICAVGSMPSCAISTFGESPLVFSDIKGFQNFPQSLLAEIKWSTCSACIRLHPLFGRIMASHAGAVYRICGSAVAELSCRWGHELFHVGTLAEQMLFVKSGCLQYRTTRPVEEDLCVLHRSSRISGKGLYRSSLATVESVGKLLRLTGTCAPEQGDAAPAGDCVLIRPAPEEEARYPWICEAALWCVWTHHGTAVARENSVVLAVQSAALQSAVADDVPVREAFRAYAQAFARDLGERAARCDWHNYIGIVNDYQGGDRSDALATLAVARADQELARISNHMRHGMSTVPPVDVED